MRAPRNGDASRDRSVTRDFVSLDFHHAVARRESIFCFSSVIVLLKDDSSMRAKRRDLSFSFL